jgi:uncharacterized membrane protein
MTRRQPVRPLEAWTGTGSNTEGTSALFLLSSDATVDKVQDAFKDTQMELIRSNLSNEQEAKLSEDFAG